MNYKEQLEKDLEFTYEQDGLVALYKEEKVLFFENSSIEIESIKQRVISVLTKNVPNLEEGEIFVINGESLKCQLFEHDLEGIETTIVLSKV